jgi:hypothetical protein
MFKSIACNIKCLADDILDPHIINPIPSIRKRAEKIYQEFISSKEGRALYDSARKKFSGNIPAMTEEIIDSLRSKIMEAAKDDPNKFQLIRAYVRDKIFDGLI